jgi:hypothetical protein
MDDTRVVTFMTIRSRRYPAVHDRHPSNLMTSQSPFVEFRPVKAHNELSTMIANVQMSLAINRWLYIHPSACSRLTPRRQGFQTTMNYPQTECSLQLRNNPITLPVLVSDLLFDSCHMRQEASQSRKVPNRA